MFGRKFLTVGFGLALLADASCSRPLCDVNSDDSRCTAETMGDMSNGGVTVNILPKRISVKTGNTLQVEISNLENGESIKQLQLKQLSSGHMIDIPVTSIGVATGRLTAPLTPALLNGFQGGPVTVIVSRNGKPDLSGSFRLFLPTLYNAKFNAFVNSPNTPLWIGTWNRFPPDGSNAPTILALNSFNSGTQRSIRQYKYQTGQDIIDLNANYMTDMASGFTSETTLGISGTNIYIPIPDISASPSNYFLHGCQLPSGNCTKTITNLGSGKITSVSVSRDDMTFALANNGKLQVYYRTSAGVTPVPVDVDQAPPSMVNWVGVGDLDGDGRADVVAGLQGAEIKVFMRIADNKLQYDDGKSTALKKALDLPGTPPASAVSAFTIGDSDGDGLADLLVARNNQINLFINQGNSVMQADFSAKINYTSGSAPIIDGMSIGDIDGNSINDICFTASNIKAVAPIINTAIY